MTIDGAVCFSESFKTKMRIFLELRFKFAYSWERKSFKSEYKRNNNTNKKLIRHPIPVGGVFLQEKSLTFFKNKFQ